MFRSTFSSSWHCNRNLHPQHSSHHHRAYEPRNWGKAIGLHDSAASFSIFSIPILMAYGLQFFSYKIPLLLLGIVSRSSPSFSGRSLSSLKEPLQKGEGYISLFKKRTIWIMILVWILSSASSMGVYSILPLYLIKERGIDFDLANNLLGISRVRNGCAHSYWLSG